MAKKKYKVKVSKEDLKNFPISTLKPDSFWRDLYENPMNCNNNPRNLK